ncbi:putative MFS family arabinose efflux permease [Tumebacillus sp. BK434]|uniref:MFS transporter n=1 Tax=Tumebacillus sp. BK434 TaxID=2512169 RepID=UPI001051A0D0|nr:MFS transporter [Tumebacillus sp. BK434]TCP54510.1 putative MFS family arabinose efflux permease [Tumebacillus sp. BK434]
MNRTFYLYVNAFSHLGTMMDMIVVNSLMISLTGGNTLWLSACLGIRVLGGLLASLYSGVLADRFDRKKIMLFTDFARAALLLLIIAFPTPVMILIISFLIGFLATFFQVAFSAEVPQIFGEDKVLEVNALIMRLSSIAMVIGFFSSGIVTEKFGFTTVLAVDALSFVLSGVALLLMKWERTSRPPRPAVPAKGKLASILEDLREVKRYLWLKPLLLTVFGVYLVQTAGASGHNVGIPLLAAALDPAAQAKIYGFIWGTWGIGSVAATFLIVKLELIKKHLYGFYYGTAVLAGLGFITFLSSENPWLIFPVVFLVGVSEAVCGTTFNVLMQQSDNAVRGRVFGVSALLNRLGFASGFLLVPLLMKGLTMPQTIWVCQGAVIAAVLWAVWRTAAHTSKKPPNNTAA